MKKKIIIFVCGSILTGAIIGPELSIPARRSQISSTHSRSQTIDIGKFEYERYRQEAPEGRFSRHRQAKCTQQE